MCAGSAAGAPSEPELRAVLCEQLHCSEGKRCRPRRTGGGARGPLDCTAISYLWRCGIFQRGLALAAQGQGEEGVTQIRQGMMDILAAGQSWYGRMSGAAGRSCGKIGQVEEGWTCAR